MAPVIWGLPLDEIKWGKFKSSYMWNNRYHLRRTKFIVYQLAMIFSVVGESLGTAVLSDYLDEQSYASAGHPGTTIKNNDIVGAFAFNIFAGVFVAFVFGAAFFFDLFWPERHEDRGIKLAWKYCAIASAVFQLAAVLWTTVIVSTREAVFVGPDGEQRNVLSVWKTSPLSYKKNARAVAGVVFSWLGLVFIVVSCVVMWKCYAHNDVHGPLADHIRKNEDVEPGTSIEEPAPAHTVASETSSFGPPATLDSVVQSDRQAEPYNVATASTLNGTKYVL
ncbi:hypothetical protein EJ05DRAFT_373311 [Pseudovirgaria hyperparasitica]|uniref:MARVEL domain-containing protein n=1 Tax=Pseudovirgaria hyperparasitica TaxID=470096 RepID=A0A6A6W700_9PEZI|nr:uncharacterized protein EJ05DRAFT_373311 [Pseudovirgaria hyperparasitica]KAF2757979.1 hypothetical protein EJ05DRAFT_373311 [Pseudovirgaria hyperparasitica]